MTRQERRALQGIAVGGLIAGTLDISYACIATWILAAKPPAYVLQSVASGILGQPAYDGGTPVAAFGLLLHYFIATTWTLVFSVASRRLRFLLQQPWLIGPLFGVVIYLVMNWVVIPISAAPFGPPHRLVTIARGLAIHMFGIGLPIALATRWGSRGAA
jgi:hypothetical protein